MKKNCLGIRDGLVKEKNKSKMRRKNFVFEILSFLFYDLSIFILLNEGNIGKINMKWWREVHEKNL